MSLFGRERFLAIYSAHKALSKELSGARLLPQLQATTYSVRAVEVDPRTLKVYHVVIAFGQQIRGFDNDLELMSGRSSCEPPALISSSPCEAHDQRLDCTWLPNTMNLDPEAMVFQ